MGRDLRRASCPRNAIYWRGSAMGGDIYRKKKKKKKR